MKNRLLPLRLLRHFRAREIVTLRSYQKTLGKIQTLPGLPNVSAFFERMSAVQAEALDDLDRSLALERDEAERSAVTPVLDARPGIAAEEHGGVA